MWVYVDKIFCIHLICINCRLNTFKHLNVVAESSGILKAMRRSFQCRKYCFMIYFILLSSIYSFSNIIGSKEVPVLYVLIMLRWSFKSICEYGTTQIGKTACVFLQDLQMSLNIRSLRMPLGVLTLRL